MGGDLIQFDEHMFQMAVKPMRLELFGCFFLGGFAGFFVLNCHS